LKAIFKFEKATEYWQPINTTPHAYHASSGAHSRTPTYDLASGLCLRASEISTIAINTQCHVLETWSTCIWMYVHTSREVYDIRLHVFTGSCECVSFRAVRVIQCKRKSNLKGHDRKRGNLMKLLKSPSHKFHSVARIWVQEKCPESCPVLPISGCPDGPLAGFFTLALARKVSLEEDFTCFKNKLSNN